MFVAGIRRLDRIRGDGWLDCPHCHEHATQDVVDEMRFAAAGFYRFSPVSRRRNLICKRCGFKRRATAEEMASLRTVNRGIARAWLVPIGLLPFLAAFLVGLALANRSTANDSGISFSTVNLDPIAPASIRLPTTYNHSAIPSSDPLMPPVYVASDGTGVIIVRLRHYLVNAGADQVLADHFGDDVGINANGFPTVPPTGTSTKVVDVRGLKATVTYSQSGQPAVISYYAFNKDGNAYILSFQQLGTSGINEDAKVEGPVVGSLSFSRTLTPAPSPSPSPGSSQAPGSPSSTGSSTATATASPSP